jgi:predicted enzyme related to lactoylglutathione lyase
MNAPSYFEIQADDPSRAVAFYRSIFGWRFTRVDGLPVEYWRIETDGPRGGLLQRPVQAPAPAQGTNAFVCSMEVVHFDATARRITDADGRIALAKFAVPGVCWQGYFLDTEGNTFGIFQPDPGAK